MRILLFILTALLLVSCAGRMDWDYPTRSKWVIIQAESLGQNRVGCTEYKLLEPYGKHYTGHMKVRAYDDCSLGRQSCPRLARANLFLEEMSNGAFLLRKVECLTKEK